VPIGLAPLAAQSAHDEGPAQLIAEVRHQAAYHRLHPPRGRAGRIGDVGDLRGHGFRKIVNE
jgi:hypothetical protein